MVEASSLQAVDRLAVEVVEAGHRLGLPFIATSPDIGSTAPMRGSDGRALNGTVFRWLDPDLRYWEDRGFALRSAFVHAARTCAEPFYLVEGRLASWRTNAALESIQLLAPSERMGVEAAIVAPAYLPGGVIGAVVWASPEPRPGIAELFADEAARLHALSLRLMATYAEVTGAAALSAAHLTRREIQCLRWAAAGKTDQEISGIVRISAPTVRFHINNASRKLSVRGRTQAIHRAATLGYIGRALGSERLA